MDKVTDQQVSPGKWEVSVRRKDATENEYFTCQNRPAITFGEDIIRIADAEFEVWIPKGDLAEVHCHSAAKKTMIQLVEQMEPERLLAYAKRIRSEADNEDDFQVAQILTAAADMYDDISHFMMPRDDREEV